MSVHHSVSSARWANNAPSDKALDARARSHPPGNSASLDLGYLCDRLDRKGGPTGKVLFVGRQGAIGFLDQGQADGVEPEGSGHQVFRPGVVRFAGDLLEAVQQVQDQQDQRPSGQRNAAWVEAAEYLKVLAKCSGGVVDTAQFRKAVHALRHLQNDTPAKALPPGYVEIDLSEVEEKPTGRETQETHDRFFKLLWQESARIGVVTSSIMRRRNQTLNKPDVQVSSFSTCLPDDKVRARELNQKAAPFSRPPIPSEELRLRRAVQAMAQREGQDPREFLKFLLLDSAVSAYLDDPVFTALVHLYSNELTADGPWSRC